MAASTPNTSNIKKHYKHIPPRLFAFQPPTFLRADPRSRKDVLSWSCSCFLYPNSQFSSQPGQILAWVETQEGGRWLRDNDGGPHWPVSSLLPTVKQSKYAWYLTIILQVIRASLRPRRLHIQPAMCQPSYVFLSIGRHRVGHCTARVLTLPAGATPEKVRWLPTSLSPVRTDFPMRF